MLLSISASDLHTGKRVWVLSGQVCFNFLQGCNSMDLCCISCMVLSVFSRLVVANFLFSLRDINLTLGLLPPRRHVVWRDSVGVRSSRSGLKSECADIFSSEPDLWLLRHTDEPQRGRNSCLWLHPALFSVLSVSC